MSRLIPICIIIGIIVIGHISKRIELHEINERSDLTRDFRNKFIDLLNGVMSGNALNQELYYELTMNVNSVQRELGSDGIAYVKDNLHGFSSSNYMFLVNFLPEVRDIQNERNNSFMMSRFDKSARTCDDMLTRHLGTLHEIDILIRKNLYNPFSCFSDGMKFIISLPILILNWFGLLSAEHARRAKKSWIVKILNFVVVLLGIVSAIITITLGWNDFLQLIQRIASSVCNGSLLKW